jgi:hypothetical protein
MLYPENVKEYIIDNNLLSKNKLSRSRQFTKQYQLFLNFCSYNNIELAELSEYNLYTIAFCILHDLKPPKCNCGKNTAYNRAISGEIYAASCSMACRSNDKRFCYNISSTKTKLYADSDWKTNTENKKISTTMSHYGVEYPMQNAMLHKKQQKSSFQLDKDGLRGYESNSLKLLNMLYTNIVSGTDYLIKTNQNIKWKDEQGKNRRSYPDFFISDINSFIEIKSLYTREKGRYKLEKCREALCLMGFGYIIITIQPKTKAHMPVNTIESFNLEFINE